MESRTPVLLTGVRIGTSRVAGGIPLINNIAGVLHSHQVHSTMTDLQTPVYSSAPNRTRTAVTVSRFGIETKIPVRGFFRFVGPAGVGPATKRIQAQIQFGYESGFKRIAAVYLVNL